MNCVSGEHISMAEPHIRPDANWTAWRCHNPQNKNGCRGFVNIARCDSDNINILENRIGLLEYKIDACFLIIGLIIGVIIFLMEYKNISTK